MLSRVSFFHSLGNSCFLSTKKIYKTIIYARNTMLSHPTYLAPLGQNKLSIRVHLCNLYFLLDTCTFLILFIYLIIFNFFYTTYVLTPIYFIYPCHPYIFNCILFLTLSLHGKYSSSHMIFFIL